MNRDRRSSSQDPTDEPAIVQSTQSAAGLGDRGPGVERNRDVINRDAALDTPRRYEQPVEEDGDPVMPGDEATLGTKI